MKNQDILISGAGIAGLTFAFWLKKYGFNPTVIEKYSAIREGGYMIDFFGLGVDVAERMEILKAFEEADAKIEEITFVNRTNVKVGSFKVSRFKKLFNGRAYNLLRSSAARIIYEKIRNNIEVKVGTSVHSIHEKNGRILVDFMTGDQLEFDLIVGADGLHSNIRDICFGQESRYEQWYGYYACSYTFPNFLDAHRIFDSYTLPNRQVSVYSHSGDKLAALFIFRADNRPDFDKRDPPAQKQILKNEFRNAGWYCNDILDTANDATDFYFDNVSQIKMDAWSKGRICLIGDACYCPSLLSGQGTALAMVGAYILAGELKNANGDYEIAYQTYQHKMKPFVDRKQKLAEKFAKSFVPKNQLGIFLRNSFANLSFLPFLSKWFFTQFLKDDLPLESY